MPCAKSSRDFSVRAENAVVWELTLTSFLSLKYTVVRCSNVVTTLQQRYFDVLQPCSTLFSQRWWFSCTTLCTRCINVYWERPISMIYNFFIADKNEFKRIVHVWKHNTITLEASNCFTTSYGNEFSMLFYYTERFYVISYCSFCLNLY